MCLAEGKKCYQGVRKDRQIYFTIINLEPKIVKDVVLTTLILHNMLIRSPDSLDVYRPASTVDHVDENGNLTEG